MKKNNGLLSSDIVAKRKKNSKVIKMIPIVMIILSAFWTTILSTFATGDVDDALQPLMGSIIQIVLTIFLYVGILLLIWSIGQLVLAFKNEDADSKSRAMTMIVVAAVLITLKFLVKAVLESVGQGGLIN